MEKVNKIELNFHEVLGDFQVSTFFVLNLKNKFLFRPFHSRKIKKYQKF